MILEEVKGLYKIITLKEIRRTNKVKFDALDLNLIPHADAFDRVIHEPGAISPGAVGTIKRPWYMHPHQEDNLMVLHGTRYIDIYTLEHGKIETFTVTPEKVCRGDRICYTGAAMLVWPTNVFHRIRSCTSQGSASVNFAIRFKGFDIKTNFNIYDLNTKTGKHRVIRKGHLDQNL